VGVFARLPNFAKRYAEQGRAQSDIASTDAEGVVAARGVEVSAALV
jgi:hypothetical protein